MTDHKPKYAGNIIGGVLIIIIVILAWSFLKEKNEIVGLVDQNSTDTPDATDEIIEAQNYEYMDPENWEFYDNAMEDIQVLSEDQTIEYGVVRDPIDENYVYFASSTPTDEYGAVLLSIYKYNEDDYSFDRIWRAAVSNGESFGLTANSDSIPVVRVIGYDDEKLILVISDAELPMFNCEFPWLLGWQNRIDTTRMVSISLNDPYSGFNDYIPPEDVVDLFKETAPDCGDYDFSP